MSQGMNMGGSLMQLLAPMMGMMGGGGQASPGLDPALLGALSGQTGGVGLGMEAPSASPGIASSMLGASAGGAGTGGSTPAAPGMMPSAGPTVETGGAPGGVVAPGMTPYMEPGGGGSPGMMPSAGQAGTMAAATQAPQGTASPDGGLAAPEASTLDKFLGIFSGGHDKSPEGLDTFRKYNSLMSAGTALGGAIAGPGTMVGDASKELNRFAQGNIAASNVEQQQKGINDMAKSALGALGGQGQGTGTGTKLAGADKSKAGAFDAPINAPAGGEGPFGGISSQTSQTLSLDDLDKKLSDLNIAF